MIQYLQFTQVDRLILVNPLLIIAISLMTTLAMGQAILDPVLKVKMTQSDSHSICIQVASAGIVETNAQSTKVEKGITVYNQLTKREQTRGLKTKNYLQDRGIDYRSFLIAPVIISQVSNADIEALLLIDEIVAITHNETYMLSSYLSVDNAVDTRDPEEPEWGIQKIQADSVWSLGYTGQDVVVAGQDTGYEWDNLALKQQYRGWDAQTGIVNHNYRWHDAIHQINPLHNDTIIDDNTNPCGLSLNSPCDDHNHGTHTMGTMVGSDSLYQMGVAPEALWIGCRNMDRGYGSLETYLDCFEWFLAPTRIDGTAPKPWLAPDVINNSWACPQMEGCNTANFSILDQAVQNLTNAGIVVVASAGNTGDDCSTIVTPAAIFEKSLSVGATNEVDTLADFSSRGPITVDSTYRMKPNVTAPGVNVRSCVRNGEYRVWSGTSMAGPHVAGAIALIISANPSLRGQVDALFDLLQSTAVPLTLNDHCEEQSSPNNLYGYGRINVLKAVEKALLLSNVEQQSPDTNNLKITPNPATDKIQINDHAMNLLVTNTLGKVVANSTDAATIDISALQSGTYILTVIDTDGRVRSSKFVKI